MAYVMLGRCERYEDLYICGDFNPGQIRCMPSALNETLALEKKSLKAGTNDDSSKLTLCYLNIRSLEKHFLDIQRCFYVTGCDLICLGETWLQGTNEPDLDGYASCAATKGRGKGVLTYSKPGFEMTPFVTDLFQIIKAETADYKIFAFYVSSHCSLTDLTDFASKIGAFEKNAILIGDFNFNELETNTFTKALERKCFQQVVKEPTHEKGGLLDHVYISQELIEKISVTILHVYFSDHPVLHVKINK